MAMAGEALAVTVSAVAAVRIDPDALTAAARAVVVTAAVEKAVVLSVRPAMKS